MHYCAGFAGVVCSRRSGIEATILFIGLIMGSKLNCPGPFEMLGKTNRPNWEKIRKFSYSKLTLNKQMCVKYDISITLGYFNTIFIDFMLLLEYIAFDCCNAPMVDFCDRRSISPLMMMMMTNFRRGWIGHFLLLTDLGDRDVILGTCTCA